MSVCMMIPLEATIQTGKINKGLISCIEILQ